MLSQEELRGPHQKTSRAACGPRAAGWGPLMYANEKRTYQSYVYILEQSISICSSPTCLQFTSYKNAIISYVYITRITNIQLLRSQSNLCENSL